MSSLIPADNPQLSSAASQIDPARQTRVNSSVFKALVAEIITGIFASNERLKPYVPMLTDAQRRATSKPPSKFDDAARQLVQAASARPDLTQAIGFNSEAMVEDLDNVKTLLALKQVVDSLKQSIDDSLLLWRAEAYDQGLRFYNVASVLGAKDAELQQAIRPMKGIWGTSKERVSSASSDEK